MKYALHMKLPCDIHLRDRLIFHFYYANWRITPRHADRRFQRSRTQEVHHE